MQTLPPLRELQAFEAVARLLSFRKAAEEMSVTPTAVSHQIRLLEEYCGRTLFIRRPRPISLTQAGAGLLPVVSTALAAMAAEFAAIRGEPDTGERNVTATNAFAARWLVPRLADWRARFPHLLLNVVGTDEVLNLRTGEADVAIRYARAAPSEGPSIELARDRFHMVACPDLVRGLSLPISATDLLGLPLIEIGWPASDTDAPKWRHWEKVARELGKWPVRQALRPTMRFHEELHGMQAVAAGQGVGLCSDILAAAELASGALIKIGDFSLPGYGFHVVWRKEHPHRRDIEAFARWACEQSGAGFAAPD
jgi:LysR family glycine cleavage system transcriptional activator